MSTTASQQATIEPSSKFTPEGDTFTLGGKTFSSRLILGSGKFSLPLIKAVAEEGYKYRFPISVPPLSVEKVHSLCFQE